jgi:DNA polymerase III epsilon subunit-like protein
MNKWVFVDVETTGLDPVAGSIISLALIVDGKEYYWKIKPTTPVTPGAAAINGYTEDDWKDAIDIKSIATEVGTLWYGRVAVGHCVDFDLKFIRESFNKAGVRCWTPFYCIDTMQLALEHLEGLVNQKLVTVASACGQTVAGNHNALVDCRLTKAVFEKLYRMQH